MRIKTPRRVFAGILLFTLLVSVSAVPAKAAAEWPQGAAPALSSDAAIVMDAKSGVILYELNMDEKRYPASITKVMTALLALENADLADTVTVTEEAAAYAVGGSANQRTKAGETFTLEELLYGTMLASANDMATAVGVYIGGGSIEAFADMMNARAAELGCTGTHFVNACGMPDDQHYTTAHDMARIFRAALKNNEFRKIIGTHSYTIPPTNMTETERSLINHDPLLTNPSFAYPGIVGGKTGNTDAAGQTLVNGVNQNGMELIVVTMRAPDAPSAAEDHVKLFDYAYEHFTLREVGMPAYRTSGGFISLPKGAEASDCEIAVSEDEEQGLVTYTYTYRGTWAGEMVMTKENEKLYLDALAEKEEEPSGESGSKEESVQNGTSGSASSEPQIRSGESAGESVETVTVTPGPGGERPSVLRKILVVLGVLVAAGMVTVLVSIHLTRERRRRYKQRRKRKMAEGKKDGKL